ncbi:unnamed protein product, partial [Thlaspi arvense]
MSFDLFFNAGGYWARDGSYLGGDPHEGYEDNMSKISWFPPETIEREDIEDDETMQKAARIAAEFRENPNISAMQLQNKLLRCNINVPWTICERTMKMKELKEYDPVAHADLKINIWVPWTRLFLVSGILCSHICSALRLEKNADQNPRTLISSWYSTENLKRCYEIPMGPVNGMNLWKITTDEMVRPSFFKSPGGRPPGKKRKKEKGEKEAPGVGKRGIKIHCGNCGEEGHNKSRCKNAEKPKPPKKPPGRPRVRPIADSAQQPGSLAVSASAWDSAEPASLSQPVQNEIWRPWGEAEGRSFSQSAEGESLSQLAEDLPSLSSALPKRKPGRPRKYPHKGASSSQPSNETIKPQKGASSSQPTYDRGPTTIPREGYGIFTSPVTGDDYIQVGRSVTDARDNTILPSTLYNAREQKKLDVARRHGRGRGRGRASGSSQ